MLKDRRILDQLGYAVAIALTILVSSCASRSSQALNRYEFQQPQMGVPFRIILYATDAEAAEKAANAAFARFKQLNDIMSDYDYESELSTLSRTSGSGRAVKVSDDLWSVLTQAQEWSERSRGAFDVTVGPCVNLWRKARREGKMPDPNRLAEARKAVGYEKVRLNLKDRTVKLLVPNMRLDLGGIAKGYAADEGLKVLGKHGIRRAMVAAAGDMAFGEAPPGKKGWSVEVASLDVTNAPPSELVFLSHAALSTSGDLFQHLEIDGKRYSHVIDPRTGIGLTDHSLVTVIAKNSTTADSISKVVSVLGPVKGLKLVESLPGVAARILRKPGEKMERFESKKFRKFCE